MTKQAREGEREVKIEVPGHCKGRGVEEKIEDLR